MKISFEWVGSSSSGMVVNFISLLLVKGWTIGHWFLKQFAVLGTAGYSSSLDDAATLQGLMPYLLHLIQAKFNNEKKTQNNVNKWTHTENPFLLQDSNFFWLNWWTSMLINPNKTKKALQW